MVIRTLAWTVDTLRYAVRHRDTVAPSVAPPPPIDLECFFYTQRSARALDQSAPAAVVHFMAVAFALDNRSRLPPQCLLDRVTSTLHAAGVLQERSRSPDISAAVASLM